MNHAIEKKKRYAAADLYKKSGMAYITCPECHEGEYGGNFYLSCDNPKCGLYNGFAMASCGICRSLRRDCSC